MRSRFDEAVTYPRYPDAFQGLCIRLNKKGLGLKHSLCSAAVGILECFSGSKIVGCTISSAFKCVKREWVTRMVYVEVPMKLGESATTRPLEAEERSLASEIQRRTAKPAEGRDSILNFEFLRILDFLTHF